MFVHSLPPAADCNRDTRINNSSLSLCLLSCSHQRTQDSLRLYRGRFNKELQRGANGTDVDFKAPHGIFVKEEKLTF